MAQIEVQEWLSKWYWWMHYCRINGHCILLYQKVDVYFRQVHIKDNNLTSRLDLCTMSVLPVVQMTWLIAAERHLEQGKQVIRFTILNVTDLSSIILRCFWSYSFEHHVKHLTFLCFFSENIKSMHTQFGILAHRLAIIKVKSEWHHVTCRNDWIRLIRSINSIWCT